MPVACVLHRVYNDFKTGEVFGRHINHKYFSLKSNHKATATLKSFYQVKPMSLFCQQLFALLQGRRSIKC